MSSDKSFTQSDLFDLLIQNNIFLFHCFLPESNWLQTSQFYSRYLPSLLINCIGPTVVVHRFISSLVCYHNIYSFHLFRCFFFDFSQEKDSKAHIFVGWKSCLESLSTRCCLKRVIIIWLKMILAPINTVFFFLRHGQSHEQHELTSPKITHRLFKT